MIELVLLIIAMVFGLGVFICFCIMTYSAIKWCREDDEWEKQLSKWRKEGLIK